MTWLRRLLGHGPTAHAETPAPLARGLTETSAPLYGQRIFDAAMDEARDLSLRPELLVVAFVQDNHLVVDLVSTSKTFDRRAACDELAVILRGQLREADRRDAL